MRKRSRLPAVIVCLLILGFAGFNTWQERTAKSTAITSTNPFIVMRLLQEDEQPNSNDAALVKVGSFDSQGILTETKLPEYPEEDFVYPLFTFEVIPENTAAVVEQMTAVMKSYARDHHKIEDLYIEIAAKDIDFEKLYDFTQALRLGLHQRYWINIFIKTSWLGQGQENIVQLKNLTRARGFSYMKNQKAVPLSRSLSRPFTVMTATAFLSYSKSRLCRTSSP
jgi:hypothetical protein